MSTQPRRCYLVDETMLTEHGYVPSAVTEGEAGHTPMTGNGEHASPWYWGHDLAKAKAIAAQANAELGLSERDVLDIIVSSMNAGPARR